MKARVYLKIAKSRKYGYRVNASTKPNYEPIYSTTNTSETALPTVVVALDLDIPDKEFESTRILLQQKIESAQPAIEIKELKQDVPENKS